MVLELINRGANTGAYHETLENYVQVEIFSKLSAEQKEYYLQLQFTENRFRLKHLQTKNSTRIYSPLVESGLARQADARNF